MFKIKPAYSIGPFGDDKMVADAARDVWLQRIGNVGHDQPGAKIFKLV
ncbi:hypothetical protein [Hoeflea sp.]|nr:hypothetical protein [Hoeflea sp.]MBC7281647.1 hypothetical protein [Hoeflea sp.]